MLSTTPGTALPAEARRAPPRRWSSAVIRHSTDDDSVIPYPCMIDRSGNRVSTWSSNARGIGEAP
jgi:hypothetical protein